MEKTYSFGFLVIKFMVIKALITVTHTKACIETQRINQSLSVDSLSGEWYLLKYSKMVEKQGETRFCALQPLQYYQKAYNFLNRSAVITNARIAILHYCNETENSSENDYVIILSRDRFFSLAAAEAVEKILRNLGVKTELIDVDQSECGTRSTRSERRKVSFRQLLTKPTAEAWARLLFQQCLSNARFSNEVYLCIEEFNARRNNLNN